MICPKCGRTIEDEMLYCGYCGEEIRIVPDFVPEVELSIEESLNMVVNEINEDAQAFDGKVSERIVDTKPSKGIFHYIYICAVALFALVLCVMLGLMIYHDNSASYQIKLGDKYYEKGNFKQACGYYGKAIEIKPTEIEYRARLADCYIAMEDVQMAVETYRGLLDYNSESTLAYNRIISIYEGVSEYDMINDFIEANGDDAIKEAFAEYLAPTPELSSNEDKYDEAIVITMSDFSDGTIYYTEDGSVPNEKSKVYKSPVFLKKGVHVIKAVFINKYGVSSAVVSKEFAIDSLMASEPIITLASGDYSTPQLIRAVALDDCNIYYTIDGSEPDETSRIYCEPIPLPEGDSEYCFVAINSKGMKSETVTAKYRLNVAVAIDKDEAVYKLVERLVSVGYLMDFNGTLKDYPGYFTYVYSELRSIGGISLYCFNEYYNYASISRNMTSNSFGVDVLTGECYVITKTDNGVYSVNKL